MKANSKHRFRGIALAGILIMICSTTAGQAFFPPPPSIPPAVSGADIPPLVTPTPPSIPPPPPDVFVPPTPVAPPPTCVCAPPVTTQSTPEPASFVMGLIGLTVAGGYALRRRRK